MSRRARPRPIPEAPESGAIKLLCVTRRRKKKTKKKTQRTRPLLSVNTSSVLLRLHVFCGEAPRALRCASRAESRTAESRSSLRRSLDDTLNRVLPTEARTHLNPPSHTRRYCFLPPCRLFLFFFLIEQADEVRNIVSQETMVLYVIKRERKNREVAVSLYWHFIDFSLPWLAVDLRRQDTLQGMNWLNSQIYRRPTYSWRHRLFRFVMWLRQWPNSRSLNREISSTNWGTKFAPNAKTRRIGDHHLRHWKWENK